MATDTKTINWRIINDELRGTDGSVYHKGDIVPAGVLGDVNYLEKRLGFIEPTEDPVQFQQSVGVSSEAVQQAVDQATREQKLLLEDKDRQINELQKENSDLLEEVANLNDKIAGKTPEPPQT